MSSLLCLAVITLVAAVGSNTCYNIDGSVSTVSVSQTWERAFLLLCCMNGLSRSLEKVLENPQCQHCRNSFGQCSSSTHLSGSEIVNTECYSIGATMKRQATRLVVNLKPSAIQTVSASIRITSRQITKEWAARIRPGRIRRA